MEDNIKTSRYVACHNDDVDEITDWLDESDIQFNTITTHLGNVRFLVFNNTVDEMAYKLRWG